MEKSPGNPMSVSTLLGKTGMVPLGGFRISEPLFPDSFAVDNGSACVLVGNAGKEMWESFRHSGEYADGGRDPLNRWTKRKLDELARQLGAAVYYPFSKPVVSFQQVAKLAIGVRGSPLGILVHPEYGLWFAFRAVLVFSPDSRLSDEVEKLIQQPHNLIHPCDNCLEKPCLTSCPVSAFSLDGLDVKSCFQHLDSSSEPECMNAGCRARDACPVGTGYRYSDEQVRFHMHSYRH